MIVYSESDLSLYDELVEKFPDDSDELNERVLTADLQRGRHRLKAVPRRGLRRQRPTIDVIE